MKQDTLKATPVDKPVSAQCVCGRPAYETETTRKCSQCLEYVGECGCPNLVLRPDVLGLVITDELVDKALWFMREQGASAAMLRLKTEAVWLMTRFTASEHETLKTRVSELEAALSRKERSLFDADLRLSQFEGFVHERACPLGGKCLCESFAIENPATTGEKENGE